MRYRESWQQPSHEMMWRLNQLSSTVHTACTWSLQHCTNPRTSQWGWHAECVVAAICMRGGFILWRFTEATMQATRDQCICTYVCTVRVREQLINHVAARTLHSSSLKDDYLLSLQMTTTMMHSPVLFWCAWTRTGSWLDNPNRGDDAHTQCLQIYAALSLFCQVHICTKVLCEQHKVCYVIMVTVYFTTSSGLGAS